MNFNTEVLQRDDRENSMRTEIAAMSASATSSEMSSSGMGFLVRG